MKKVNSFLLCTFLLLVFASGAYCYQINIQPIQVADDNGTYSHAIQIDETQWDTIWSAAGIDINFLPTTRINSDTYNVLTYEEMGDLLQSRNGYGQSTDPYVVNYWYVDDFVTLTGEQLLLAGNSLNGVDGRFSSGFILNGDIASTANAPLIGSYFLARYVGLDPVLEDRNIVANYESPYFLSDWT